MIWYDRVETPPTSPDDFLAYDEDGEEIFVCYYEDGKWIDEYGKYRHVTHYMELPERPNINYIKNK